jgi:YbbR domain-containing protein
LIRLGGFIVRLVLALGLSLGLWVFVSLSENPDEQANFEGLTLTPRGIASGLVLVDQNSLPNPILPDINVTVVTDRRQRTLIRPVDLRAFIDLSEFGPGDYTVPVGVEIVRSDLSITIPEDGIEPRTVSVRIEDLITATVPITLVIQGNLPFSFELGQPEVRQNGRPIETINVQGPESRVQRVVAARAVANVDQIRASYSAPLQLVPIDANGQLVEGVTIEQTSVNVSIPVRPVVGLRLVPIQATVTGLPAPGYAIASITVTPTLITLTGNSGALDRVASIATEEINISGARGRLEVAAELVFPNGTSAGPQEGEQVTVIIDVVPITQPFQVTLPVQVTLSGIGRGLIPTLQPQIITVTLSGESAALGRLAAQPLLANVDLNGLGAGSYVATPRLNLPTGINVVGALPEVTITLRVPATPEPTETATNAPTNAPSATPGNEPTTEATPTPDATTPPEDTPTASPGVSPEPVPTATPTP